MRFWGRFRDWRRSRPFWGGLLTLLSGAEIVYLPLSPLNEIIAAGVAGVQSLLVGFLILVMGLFVWFSPANRLLAGVLTIIFSVSSLVLSNLGGLVVGMMLGILGGAMTIAWTDRPRGGRRRSRPVPAEEASVDAEPAADERPDAGIAIVEPDRPALRLLGPARRWAALVTLVALGAVAPVPAIAAPASAVAAPEPPAPTAGAPAGVAQPTGECVAALAALPAGLVDGSLPALTALLPGLDGLLAPARGLLSGLPLLPLLGAPAPEPPAEDPAEVLRQRQVAAQACGLPQLLPPSDGTVADPFAPLVPLAQLPAQLVPGLAGLPPVVSGPGGGQHDGSLLPDLPRLPVLPSLPGLPDVPGLPSLPSLPPLPGQPTAPELPLPGLPIPQVPRVPFPELPGLPGLPGNTTPPGTQDPPLPVAPQPAAGQRLFAADDGDVAPATVSDLTMATLNVSSLVYQGIVELPTAAGGTVQALRFHMDTIDADQLTIAIPTFTGHQVLLRHTPGQHVTGSDVTLDCTRLSLVAYGALPLTFTVDSPPPPILALPALSSTDVDIDLVTLKLGTLAVPTADATVTGDNATPQQPTSPVQLDGPSTS
jgi:Family of unknown function (DUF6114)